jgi:hypothetical protein
LWWYNVVWRLKMECIKKINYWRLEGKNGKKKKKEVMDWCEDKMGRIWI